MTNTRYGIVLALIAGIILIVGVQLKPREEQPRGASPDELVNLQRLAQRKSLQNLADHFASLAQDVSPYVVRLTELERTALVWEPDTLVTAEAGGWLQERVTVLTPAGEEVKAETTASSPLVPVAALHTPPEAHLKPARRLERGEPRPGAWTVVVARGRGGELLFVPGTYAGSVAADCGEALYFGFENSVSLDENMLGGGLFDLDQNLLGIVTRCSGHHVILAASGVEAALEQAQSFNARLLRRYGLRVRSLDEDLKRHFGVDSGLLVAAVWGDSTADRVGLKPGDIVHSLDGQEIAAPEDLLPLVEAADRQAFSLTVHRGRRDVFIEMPRERSERPPESAPAGLVPAGALHGVLIESVQPGSRAARAGVHRGDRLLEIDGRPVTDPAELRHRLLAQNGKPAFLLLQRDARRLGVLLR